MEQDSRVRESLVSQIENAYGKVVYTFTCHNKRAHIYSRLEDILSWSDIILTAITAGGLLALLFSNEKALAIISACCAALSLMINLYQKDAKLTQRAEQHRAFAQLLWLPREKYISLLTDAPALTTEVIQARRDQLSNEVNIIYSNQPITGGLAYKQAQRAIKRNGEQFFERQELNNMLPEQLRRQ